MEYKKTYEITKSFSNVLENLDGLDYLLSKIAYSIAATLEGRKPSNLITFIPNKKNAIELWNIYNKEVAKTLDLDYFELYRSEERCVVLFYNKEMLEEYVFNGVNIKFLEEFGYSYQMDLIECLEQLRSRFTMNCPHELGIFLGIPLGDVKGFIANEGKECLMCKYWKVYDNLKDAMCTFESYDQAKINMMKRIIKTFEVNNHTKDTLRLSF